MRPRVGGGVKADPTKDERYTRRETLSWALRLLGIRAFGLDVAACRAAHVAPRFYTKRENGLVRPWRARFVWCNPPYSDIAPWVARAWASAELVEFEALAMLIPATRTEQPWWQELIEPWRDRAPRVFAPGIRVQLTSHFAPGRTRFGNPDDVAGEHVGSPDFTSVLLVWRIL